jgi:hypothetical protein
VGESEGRRKLGKSGTGWEFKNYYLSQRNGITWHGFYSSGSLWQVAGHCKHSNYALRVPFMRGIDLLHVISKSGFLFLGCKVSEIWGFLQWLQLCDAVWYSRNLSSFRRCLLPPLDYVSKVMVISFIEAFVNLYYRSQIPKDGIIRLRQLKYAQ